MGQPPADRLSGVSERLCPAFHGYVSARPAAHGRGLNTTYSLTSLTVSGFLLLFALSMLIWGPLSDKYGRRPVLLTGGAFYVLSSVGIALAGSIGPLLFWRGLQAVSSGAISSMSLAVVKDILRGSAMEKVVTWIQTVTILAPMLAPVAGGGLLLLTDWRGIFWCLACCGLLALAGGLALRETRARATQGSVFNALGRIFVVLRTPGFGAPLLLFSAMSMPFMAYLAVSSYVFQTRFGLSAQEYSWFFAFNAVMSLLGPLLHMRFSGIGGAALLLPSICCWSAWPGACCCSSATRGRGISRCSMCR